MIRLAHRIWRLARPYGVYRLILVMSVNVTQAVIQVVGVASIFPFLAVASGPDRIRNSTVGRVFLDVFPGLDNQQLLIYSGVIAIVGLFVANVANIFAEYYRNWYAHRYGHWLREQLIQAYLERGYLYFAQRSYSILHKKLVNDVMTYVTGVLLPALDIVSRLLIILLLGVLLFLVDPIIAVSTLGFFLSVYLLLFSWLRPLRDKYREQLKVANRGANFEALQFFNGIKAILVHGASQYFVDRYLNHSYRQAKVLAVVPVYGNLPRYLIEPLAFGGLVAYVLFLVSQDRSFSDVLPNLGVIALASSRILPSLQLLYGNLNQLTVMKHSLEELEEEFDGLLLDKSGLQSNESGRVLEEWSNSIELRDVSFQYASDERLILKEVSLSIAKGDRVVFKGESGAGKSTLIDLFLSLRQPTSGSINVDDVNLNSLQTSSWHRMIGYVPQEVYLLDGTLLENIAFGESECDVDMESVWAACRIASLEKLVSELPEGLNTQVGDRGANLSGGQRQRIGIARALYHRPSILVLDEATSSLDEETERQFLENLNALPRSLTILMVTHRVNGLEDSREYVLSDGNLETRV